MEVMGSEVMGSEVMGLEVGALEVVRHHIFRHVAHSAYHLGDLEPSDQRIVVISLGFQSYLKTCII